MCVGHDIGFVFAILSQTLDDKVVFASIAVLMMVASLGLVIMWRGTIEFKLAVLAAFVAAFVVLIVVFTLIETTIGTAATAVALVAMTLMALSAVDMTDVKKITLSKIAVISVLVGEFILILLPIVLKISKVF